ncbi:hypothetical protein Poli38472_004811 [Pythium oligandrum]|uniref:VASt domain-containing protein n=1 Tax=Pythium oligandrum TaxID=41045 RepID=A0A8K1CCC2_PYTOL|nr:hypothetical protein Poli38472_004811 [Pythium oligandrum]|eukprot:TMW59742.1 hypothetical protein Poli38472_004811 [Pythium oligandrum]
MEATWIASLVTSTALFLALRQLANVSLLPLLFFTLLPTLSALACLQDRRFYATFKRLFQWALACEDPDDEATMASKSTTEALAAAKNELLKELGDHWPVGRGGGGGIAARNDFTTSSDLLVGSATSASGGNKTLYEQVKGQLMDHVFQNQQDSPIYFMDTSSGCFLRVNEQHKLAFTTTPDASCLFHVVKGKTHHWGFYSTLHQRYIGQNFIGKMIVSSRKLNSWEAFRVLEKPEEKSATATGPKTVYLVLCSARFGKGMWLAKNRRRASNPSEVVYLSKNFPNALALAYASDLAAFESVMDTQEKRPSLTPSTTSSASLHPTASASSLTSLGSAPSLSSLASPTNTYGSTFQPPVLAAVERPRVLLPWIEDAGYKKFFELPEKQMTEVISTTIARVTVRDFIELFIDLDARRQCHEKTSLAPMPRSASTPNFGNSVPVSPVAMNPEKRLSEWHLHPHFGFVRKLSYRPPAPGDSTENDTVDGFGRLAAETSSSVASVAIDQYDSCSMNEKTMHKAVMRSKLYTLSIPCGNCFSVETVFEFRDITDRDTVLSNGVTMLSIKCKTGVHFTRPTQFASEIERGVLEGVKNTCDAVLSVVDDIRRAKKAVRLMKSSPNLDASSSMLGSSEASGVTALRDAIPPHTLAVEVIKGMLASIRRFDGRAKTSRSSLVMQMPWLNSLSATPSSKTASKSTTLVKGFFETPAVGFTSVVDEDLGPNIAPSLVFQALFSDECSFFHTPSQTGNMEVDIGAWRLARAPIDGGAHSVQVRKQVFQMPVSGIPGIEVARIEDYQYYALDKSNPERLEFGMKVFAADLPQGDRFSIEILVQIEQTVELSTKLRVSYVVAAPSATNNSSKPSLSPHLAIGAKRGLQDLWQRVARVLVDATHSNNAVHFSRLVHEPHVDEVRHRLQLEGKLPTHDELSSKVIEAIAALY